jgi:hypothetical protein
MEDLLNRQTAAERAALVMQRRQMLHCAVGAMCKNIPGEFSLVVCKVPCISSALPVFLCFCFSIAHFALSQANLADTHEYCQRKKWLQQGDFSLSVEWQIVIPGGITCERGKNPCNSITNYMGPWLQ